MTPFASDDGTIHTAALYKLLTSVSNSKDAISHFIWDNCAPPRVQFFAWLAADQ